MKYTVGTDESIENLIHNMNKIQEHIELKEIMEEYDEKYFAMLKLKHEMTFHLGQWYFIKRNR